MPSNSPILAASGAPDKTGDVGTDTQTRAQPGTPLPPEIETAAFAGSFWSRMKQAGECWEWGEGSADGRYGKVYVPAVRAQYRAHRVAYFLSTGTDPGDMRVCHKCDNPRCCKPSHLFLGTDADNSRDMVAKGRHPTMGKAGSANIKAALTEADVAEIVAAIESGAGNQPIAERYGITNSAVSHIRNGKSWRHVTAALGYHPAKRRPGPERKAV